jgi:hypothetical protein
VPPDRVFLRACKDYPTSLLFQLHFPLEDDDVSELVPVFFVLMKEQALRCGTLRTDRAMLKWRA